MRAMSIAGTYEHTFAVALVEALLHSDAEWMLREVFGLQHGESTSVISAAITAQLGWLRARAEHAPPAAAEDDAASDDSSQQPSVPMDEEDQQPDALAHAFDFPPGVDSFSEEVFSALDLDACLNGY